MYGPGGFRKQLADFSAPRYGDSLDYVEGDVFICGDVVFDDAGDHCRKGEHQSDTGGGASLFTELGLAHLLTLLCQAPKFFFMCKQVLYLVI